MTESTFTSAPKRRRIGFASLLVLAAAVAGAGASFALQTQLPPKTEPAFVTFDTVRYLNARRAVAIELMGTGANPADQAVSTLARVDRGVVPSIEEVADGRFVLVRQALVLDGSLPDITDEVLESLGLPADAPSIEPKVASEPVTRYSQSPLYTFAEEYVQSENARAREQMDRQNREGFNDLLP